MRSTHRYSILTLLITSLALSATGCRSSNRLIEYDFHDRTLTAVTSMPVGPEVLTDHFLWFNPDRPLRSMVRLGARVVREDQAARAQTRLDSAYRLVDVESIIDDRSLDRCSAHMRAVPVYHRDEAAFVLDIFVRNFGLEADSWTAAVRFRLDADVALLDNPTGAVIWKTRVREREPVGLDMWGLGPTINDFVSAELLSNLSVEDIAAGLERMAEYTADRIADRLRRDLHKSMEHRAA